MVRFQESTAMHQTRPRASTLADERIDLGYNYAVCA